MLINSIILAQGAMILMLQAFQRHVSRNTGNSNKRDSAHLMHRQVPLLCTVYNELHKSLLTPLVVLNCGIGTAVSLFILMTTILEKEMQILVVFCNLLLISISLLLLAFQFAAKFYVGNKQFVITQFNWKHDEVSNHFESRRDRDVMKRYCRCYPILKIFCFESNYFEGNTSLVVLNFSINCAINLVLCGK